MIRALIYILLLAGLAITFAWFADRPGQLTVNWPGYRIEISLFWFTVVIVIATGLLFFVLTLIGRLIGSPRRLRRHFKNRRRARGYAALRHGIFAVGAGDESTAARYAVEARRTMPNEPLTELLQAQSAQLSGDRRTAQRIFEAMSEDPETRLLGLRGLFLEASREGQMEAAEQYAARAMALNPNLPWPVHSLFEMQCKARNWHGALETLAVARSHRHIDRRVHDRRRAVLLTAQAKELEEKESGRAIDLAIDAHRLAPDFVPAAVIAGRILASQGNTARAARVLARTWQYAPHPDLALGYAYVRPGDSPRDRLARIKSLIVMTPDEPEARIALASAAVDARDWQEARDALEPLLGKAATARVCALMARIEGGENRDAGKVREWLAKAVRAPRDAVWMADGVISNEWQPVSPVSGALDAFQWCVPLDQSKTERSDPLFDEISDLSRELETVARQIGDASLEDHDTHLAEKSEPLTITVKAEETTVSPPQPENEPEAVASPDQETRAAQSVETPTPVPDDRTHGPADTAEPSEKPKEADQDASSSSALVRGAARAREEAERRAAAHTRAKEAAKTAAAKDAVVKLEARPAASAEKKTPPKIFVPERPPDDPGPGSLDLDEASTPYMRVRNPLKQQSS